MLEGSEVIAIQFSDTGVGIPEELLPRIFDPFFTTKDPGSGMGMGLSLAHRIIESFHGEIEVHSVAGQGADVTIFLPPSRKKPENQTTTAT
jgi:signal transduction histidine kinase